MPLAPFKKRFGAATTKKTPFFISQKWPENANFEPKIVFFGVWEVNSCHPYLFSEYCIQTTMCCMPLN